MSPGIQRSPDSIPGPPLQTVVERSSGAYLGHRGISSLIWGQPKIAPRLTQVTVRAVPSAWWRLRVLPQFRHRRLALQPPQGGSPAPLQGFGSARRSASFLGCATSTTNQPKETRNEHQQAHLHCKSVGVIVVLCLWGGGCLPVDVPLERGTSGLVFRLVAGGGGRDSHLHWPRVFARVSLAGFVRSLLPVPAWPPRVA
jgi:hypothetical protein